MAQGIRFEVDKTDNYTTMSNQHFHVVNMSLRAKGLLSLILSLPREWDYSIAGLTTLCKESYNTVSSVLKELQSLGYLTIEKLPPRSISEGGTGRFEYVYTIYENSITPEKLQFKWSKS